VKYSVLTTPLLALGIGVMAYGQTAAAPTPTKVGTIQIQQALIQTKDGQKAAAELDAKFAPKKQELEKKNNELQQLQKQYQQGVNTMSDDAKTKLARDIDQRTKQLQRDVDDAQQESEQEQGKVLNELYAKMKKVLDKYALDHGYALIIDVSSPQTPVLYASSGVDITADIIQLYDKTYPAPAASTPAAPPAAPPAAAAKPPVKK
jgi:outer membrane protein